MKKVNTGRSLFVLQISVLLMFFIFASAACVSLFVFSNEKNTQANDLNSASIAAVSAADTIKSCGKDTDRAKKLLGANEAFEIYYDSDWQPGGRRVYCAAVDLSIKDDLLTAVIQFSRVKDGQLIYRLETKEFLGVTVQ